ncbi:MULTISPECIES: 1,6-anhydro-N-acetylmuramyl-L-alanine amidase AmpD [Halomonadaceae]|uniref:1,6-anhydro-N-acetylmuramyl-L-alanine amidase AmpD n=1 Tax=Vreelandella halophila TaxID=86177 RepID=A0A9X5B3J5_9GAMM|nr:MULTISPECIES: 1,6-anhydro-N-acetylmuramyl-L-alanine amidase AmpD [Halomonas]MYL25690.1 1,6-anhydro-N-acetylmuramyl-L-alanine amidase AmpD [Halomonas utahensis]MYL76035.1 1,6-anhydro-N-acetylmuramyl-L-alanine amidase AmpD [Halomonas sp. 22501_18_FS]
MASDPVEFLTPNPEGWLPAAHPRPSDNHDARPAEAGVSLLVIHGISLPPGEFGGDAIERLFCNTLDCSEHPWFERLRNLRVSAHLLIRRDGQLVQFVSLLDRAWHAGRSCFNGQAECNDFGIGIELEGADDTPYTEAQYDRLIPLARGIMRSFPSITPDRVVGHADIAPERKTDPGPAFDWLRLRRGIAQTAEGLS